MPEDFSNNDKTESYVPLLRGTSIEHYRIIKKIGAGGMGEVYLAEDTKLNRQVALKFLPPHLCQDEDCRKRFKREAQAAAKLNHPNIITIYEVGQFMGRPYFAMEQVEGKSLREIIKNEELSTDKIISMSIQICEGLREAHEAGIVHRDIKPANIIIDEKRRLRLLDFGLAAVTGTEKLTKTGSTLGTVGYMSPEQVRGEEIDTRSDLFSFGVILYEMITGRQPFKEDYEAATFNAILNESPEPMRRYKADVPDSLQLIVDKALDKDKETRYQNAAGMLADLKRVKKELEPSGITGQADTPKKRYGKVLSPSFVIVIALLLLIFKPWKFEISSRQEAIAQENKLAIMYFENLADPTDSLKLGEITTNLLITDLSESEYVQVVSSQRLYDILKQLGREGAKKIDRNIATQIAEKANARWMLLGSILNTEPEIILTAQLIDVESGNAIASQRIEGQRGDRIFPLVDKLTVEIKGDLSLPVQALEEEDRPIMEVTTNSIEAYRSYLEGIEYLDKFYFKDARESFSKAIEYDSTFAMAYFQIVFYGSSDKQKATLAKAVKYSENASRKEKLYIQSVEEYFSGGLSEYIKQMEKILEQYPEEKQILINIGNYYKSLAQNVKALEYFNRVLELDPLYKRAYNSLAYIYDDIGDVEKSIWAINKYIEISPNEANPYDTRADLYAWNGKIDEAIESYKMALEIKSDFMNTRNKLGYMFLFKREYTEAIDCFRKLLSSSSKNVRSQGRFYLALVPLYQGKLTSALEMLDDGIAADRIEQYEYWPNSFKYALKAFIYCQMKDMDMALESIKEAMAIQHEAASGEVLYWRDHYVQLLALNNEFDIAKEDLLVLKQDIEERDQEYISAYWWAAGNIAMAKGEPEVAVSNLEEAINSTTYEDFVIHYDLARAYFESDRMGDAVMVLEKELLKYDLTRIHDPIRAVKGYYLLGLAYEKSGWDNKAIEKYETFLDIWKNADPGIEEVDDAKERLAKLKSKS